MRIDRNLVNVLVLSVGFMLSFTAFQTMGNIEKTVLDSVHDDDPSFAGDGYVSLAIIYGFFATGNWLAPSYISLTGPRVSIFTGGLCYVFFIGCFLWPNTILLYVSSAVVGIGAALIWTGQGQYLTENSNAETMSRNAGIFWALFQTSLFIGNLFVYFVFEGTKIQAPKRKLVFSVLTALSAIGTVVLATLRKSTETLTLGEAEGVSSADKELQMPAPKREKPLLAAWHAFRDSLALFITPNMLLLSITFLYTGLMLTFFSGVYSSCVGFTTTIAESSKRLVGLSGIFIGAGEVVGGALFGILAANVLGGCSGSKVVITGLIVHLLAFISIYLNLPNDAPFGNTTNIGIIKPSPILAMAGSLALGFGDACYNTQVYSLLGVMFSKESAPAFALFKFCQSIAATISFSYSNNLGLHLQLLILTVAIVLGTTTFCFVERRAKNGLTDNQPDIDPALVDVTSAEE